MHARVVTAENLPDKRDEALTIYREDIVTMATLQPGFRGATLLTDPNSNKFVSITLWESEADMLAGEEDGYLRNQLASIGPTFTGPGTTEHFVVSYQQ